MWLDHSLINASLNAHYSKAFVICFFPVASASPENKLQHNPAHELNPELIELLRCPRRNI